MRKYVKVRNECRGRGEGSKRREEKCDEKDAKAREKKKNIEEGRKS